MGGIEKERAREREKRQEGRWGGQREKKQTSNNVTYMQSHTPFFFAPCNNVYVFEEGGGARREKERRREREKGGGGCVLK